MDNEAAIQMLRQRVAELDAAQRPWATSPGAAGLLEHATSVLAARTGDPDEAGTGANAALDPAAADTIVTGCRLLADLGRERPELVGGTLARHAQHWIGTARHTAPDPAGFRPPTTTATPSPKPFGVGLFTSTAGPDGRSTWRTYLEPYRGSTLYPLPWTIWNLPVLADARVREVANAQSWAALVEDYATIHAGSACPDWHAVAADHDAIHLTMAATTAIQGLTLRTTAGPTAPVFWDTESTFWLRWQFGPARRRETVTDE